MTAQPGTAVVGSTSTEQTGRIAGAEQQQRVLEQAAAAGREDPLRWQIAFRPIVAATDALAWEKARTVLAKLESRRAIGEVIDRRPALRKQAGSRRDTAAWYRDGASPADLPASMSIRESSKARRLRRCISVGSDIWISLAWLVGILVVGYAFAIASVARSAEAELCSRQGPSGRYYPYSQLSSGMFSKFIPCTVPTSVGATRIAAQAEIFLTPLARSTARADRISSSF